MLACRSMDNRKYPKNWVTWTIFSWNLQWKIWFKLSNFPILIWKVVQDSLEREAIWVKKGIKHKMTRQLSRSYWLKGGKKQYNARSALCITMIWVINYVTLLSSGFYDVIIDDERRMRIREIKMFIYHLVWFDFWVSFQVVKK